MVILLVLVPISLLLLGLAIWAFVWAVRDGQYDDLDTPAIDILRKETKAEVELLASHAESADDAD